MGVLCVAIGEMAGEGYVPAAHPNAKKIPKIGMSLRKVALSRVANNAYVI
jgi:hypothetical protein